MTVVSVDSGEVTDGDSEVHVFRLDNYPTLIVSLLVLLLLEFFPGLAGLLRDFFKGWLHVETLYSYNGLRLLLYCLNTTQKSVYL